MYLVLIGELAKKKISNRMLAKILGTHENTIANKLNGGSFSIDEAVLIRDTFFPGEPIEKLFKKEEKEG